MKLAVDIEARDGAARTGVVTTPRGRFTVPCFMPVGTRGAVRALESAARSGPSGRTELFIHGDFEFRVVDRLLTNFHVPRSSLLALVDAFVGPRWRGLYDTALGNGYRFLSFGDAMLLDRRWGRAA